MGKKKTVRISPRMSMRKSVVTGPRSVMQIGRNDPCPCGSGEKYKICCLKKGDVFLKKMAAKQEKLESKERKAAEKAAKKEAKSKS